MAIGFSFLLLLYLSEKFNFLKSINSIERKTFGSVLYPIAIYLCFILNQVLVKNNGQYQFYFASLMILGISDPLAAIVGGKYPIFRFQKIAVGKSIGGSLAFFIAAFIISFSFLTLDNKILICLAVSLLSTLAELFSYNGFDNLFVPLSCYLLFYIFN
jgi:dolichol kinase